MSPSDTARKSAEPVGRRPLILLVDDCVQQRDMYEVALAPDFDIVTASRGADAIDVARRRLPDAIILDVRMPEMNGLDVCGYLKSDPMTESIPVILLTGADDRNLPREGAEAGAAAVLTKPCTPSVLVETIACACAQARLAG